MCVNCVSNNDCTDPKKSRCVGNTCVACDSDSDCDQIPAYPYCQPISSTKACSQCRGDTDCPFLYTGGSCTAQSGQMLCTDNSPACTTDANCASNTKYPICDTTITQPKCRRCTIDTECAVSGKPYCYPTTGASVCVQCRTGADCLSGQVCASHTCQAFTCTTAASCEAKDPTLPECDSGKCVRCPSDTKCQESHTRSYGCNTVTGACFDGATPCTTDSDCTNSFLAKCGSTNKCAPCESDANCAHISGGNNVCRIDLANTCLQCMVNIKCANSAFLVCDTDGLCKQCSSNFDCSALFASVGKSACSSLSHGCVECTIDSYCLDPIKPYCRTTIDEKCVQCLEPSHCNNSVLSKCDSSGTCSACTNNSDCTVYHGPKGLSYCRLTLGCVECVENDNCLTKSPKNICKTDPGVCVECISNSDCTTAGLTHCKLNPGICVECTDNSHCTSPALPVFSSNNTCTICSVDTECSHLSLALYCEAGVCQKCKTTDNSGCTLPNPICIANASGHICISASASSSCPNNNPHIGGSFSVTPLTGGTPLSTTHILVVGQVKTEELWNTLLNIVKLPLCPVFQSRFQNYPQQLRSAFIYPTPIPQQFMRQSRINRTA